MPQSVQSPRRRWYQDRREDYDAVQERLKACRNVMLRGRKDAAERLLRMSCTNAVLSIQTERSRHERAFTAYYAADVSLEKACSMTVYGGQKAAWLHESYADFNFGKCVRILRDSGPFDAHEYLVENFKGVSWVKGGFALAMIGIWELACPDTRTRQSLGIDHRIRDRAQYLDALSKIDRAVDADAPLFIKQWVIYDMFAGEHADHMPFYREVLRLGGGQTAMTDWR